MIGHTSRQGRAGGCAPNRIWYHEGSGQLMQVREGPRCVCADAIPFPKSTSVCRSGAELVS